MSLWYSNDSAADRASQRKVDERRAQDAAANQEWDEGWRSARTRARAVAAERKRQFAESQKPPATADENLAAIRRLLENQNNA